MVAPSTVGTGCNKWSPLNKPHFCSGDLLASAQLSPAGRWNRNAPPLLRTHAAEVLFALQTLMQAVNICATLGRHLREENERFPAAARVSPASLDASAAGWK